MSPAVVGALIAAAFVAVADWIAVARDDRAFERLAKPAVILCLFVAVVLAGPGISPARWLLIGALAASLAGDWLLLPPGQLLAGLAAFLVAHLAYLALFLLGGFHPEPATVAVVAMLILLVTAGRRILGGAAEAGMGGPVVVYFGVIAAMAVAATGAGSLLAAAGAWLFVASDTLIGWERFVAPPEPSSVAATRRRVAIIVTYHAAQLLLVIAVLGLDV